MPTGDADATHRTPDLILLFATIIFLYLLLFKLPFQPFYSEGDHLIFLYNADRMMSGERMYLDFFQFTFPGGQVLYFVLFTLFGTQFWVMPAAILVMGTASFWLLLKLSRTVIPGAWAYVPPLLFIFFGFRYWGLDGSHRMFCSLFVLLAIYFLAKGRGPAHIAGSAISCAIASYFTQQRGFVAVAAICLFLILDNRYREESWGSALKELSLMSGVFLLALGVLCGYFIVTAGPVTFFESTIVYPSLYYHFHEQNGYGVFWLHFREILASEGAGRLFSLVPAVLYGFGVPLAVAAFAVCFMLRGRRGDWEIWRAPTLMGLVTGFSVVSITNPNPLRYYLIAAPALVIGVWMLSRVNGLQSHGRAAATAIAIVLLALASTQAYRSQANWNYTEIDAPRGKVLTLDLGSMGRYRWLQQHSKPGDYVFEAYEPFVYFLLELKNPSRYTQIFPSAYTRPEFVSGTIEDLTQNPPLYILWDNSYNIPDAERAAGDHTGPLAAFVQERYDPDGPIYNVDGHPIQIWIRKGIVGSH